MTLDLNKLESKLDDALNKETTESLEEWMEKRSPMIERLKEHLDSITQEEFEKEWEEIVAMGFEGPTMEEFICGTEDCPHCAYERQQEYEAELEKEACIDFAKWLAQSDWMSIWVTDKWIWECQLEDVHSGCVGYKTEEELYQIYLNEN